MTLLAAILALQTPVTTIEAGPLTLEVRVGSRTAHIFHVVDQMSGWSQYCHPQYKSYWEKTYGPLTAAESSLLAEHAKIRGRRGWGSLEPIFYTPKSLDEALADPRLGGADAATEKKVFAAFSSRIEQMVAAESGPAEKFVQLIKAKRPELASFATNAGRLFGVKSLRLPVYLLANPDDGFIGGGYNGGMLTLEVPRKADAFPSFLHEIFHGFTEPNLQKLQQAAQGVKGLDAQTLNEGLAYALSPGIFNATGGAQDSLRMKVHFDLRDGRRLSDAYTRFNRFGLALRPLLRSALNDPNATLTTILPRAIDIWQATVELSLAAQPPERPRLLSFGPAWEALNGKAWELGYQLAAYTHVDADYKQVLANSQAGSTIVILYTPDFDARFRDVPEAYRKLLPKTMSEVEAQLAKRADVEIEGKAGTFRVVMLASPTMDGLKALIGKTKLIGAAPPAADF